MSRTRGIRNLLIGIFIVAGWHVRAQTVSGESNKVYINVTSKPKGPKAALAYSNVTFVEQRKNKAIEPLEITSLKFTVRNLGDAASRPLFIKAYVSDPIRGLSFPAEKKYPAVNAGETVEITIPITNTKMLETSTANVLIDIKEEYEYDPDQIEINILTEEKKQ